MFTNNTKMQFALAIVGSILAAFLLSYFMLLLLTLGSTIISGLYVSTLFVKVGCVGYIFTVLLSKKIKLQLKTLVAIVVNFISELTQKLLLTNTPAEQIGETVITYHHTVEASIFDLGDIILIVIVSIVLVGFHNLIYLALNRE